MFRKLFNLILICVSMWIVASKLSSVSIPTSSDWKTHDDSQSVVAECPSRPRPDGCGRASQADGFFVPEKVVSNRYDFTAACNQHDTCFTTFSGCDLNDESCLLQGARVCDIEFYSTMIATCLNAEYLSTQTQNNLYDTLAGSIAVGVANTFDNFVMLREDFLNTDETTDPKLADVEYQEMNTVLQHARTMIQNDPFFESCRRAADFYYEAIRSTRNLRFIGQEFPYQGGQRDAYAREECETSQTDRHRIVGSIFNDRNQNGLRDDGERGIPNIDVYLQPDFSETNITTFTNYRGEYSFIVDTGVYHLDIDMPEQGSISVGRTNLEIVIPDDDHHQRYTVDVLGTVGLLTPVNVDDMSVFVPILSSDIADELFPD